MRRTHWFAVAITVFALSLCAVAQPPGGGPRGPGQGPGGGGPGGGGQGPSGMGMMGVPGGMGAMFQNPQTREAFAKELELTPEQITELQRVIPETLRTQMENFPRPEPGTPPNFREMGQRMEAVASAVQTSVEQVLKPEQRTKFRDATFQLSGGLESPFLSVQSLETLNLSDAQKEQVRKLMEERNAAMGSVGEIDWRDQASREKFREELETRNARFTEQVKGILTSEQTAKAEKLTSESSALRERLGIPEPGQPRGQQGRQQGERAPGYVPGDRSWQPGQTAPGAGRQPQQPRRFPSNNR